MVEGDVGEGGAEREAAAGHAGGDRAGGHAEHVGGLGEGEVLAVDEQHGVALRLGERGERGVEPGAERGGGRVALGIVPLGCKSEAKGETASTTSAAVATANATGASARPESAHAPASASSTEQMNVRSSTRATSDGSVRAQNEFGLMLGFSGTMVPASTSSAVSRCHSSVDPSHHTTASGVVSSAISRTHARSRGWVVGAVFNPAVTAGALMGISSIIDGSRRVPNDHLGGRESAQRKPVPRVKHRGSL